MKFEKENNRRIREFWQQIGSNPLFSNINIEYKFPIIGETPVSSAIDGSSIGEIYDLHSQNKNKTNEKLIDRPKCKIQSVRGAQKHKQQNLGSKTQLIRPQQKRLIKLGYFSNRSKGKERKGIKLLDLPKKDQINSNNQVNQFQGEESSDRINEGCLECCWLTHQQQKTPESQNRGVSEAQRERINFSESKTYVQKRKIREIVSLECRGIQSVSKSKKSHQSKTTLFQKRSDKQIETGSLERNWHKKVSSVGQFSSKRCQGAKVQIFYDY